MDLIEFKSDFEKRHPWEVARYKFFSNFLKKELKDKPQAAVDVGSGDAWFSNRLELEANSHLDITCWDIGYNEATLAKIWPKLSSQLQLIPEQPKIQFDLIWMLDVLEHVEDDHTFLKSIVEQNLKDQGKILISVPAWQWLYSDHDRKLKHFRRYSPRRAKDLISSSGLIVEAHGSLFTSLLVFRCLEKLLTQLSLKETTRTLDDDKEQSSELIEFILNTDSRFSRFLARLNVDFLGLSWWALCRLP